MAAAKPGPTVVALNIRLNPRELDSCHGSRARSIVFTGNTTGRPKGALLTEQALAMRGLRIA